MTLDEVQVKSGTLKDRVTLEVLYNLLTVRGLTSTAACLQQEAGLDALTVNRARGGAGHSLSDGLDIDTVAPAMEEVLRLRSFEASTAQAEQRRRVASLTQELAKQNQQMTEIRERVHRMRVAGMSEHKPSLQEQVQKLQSKMQELQMKKHDLDRHGAETAERDALSRSLRADLDLFEREVAELRRQLEDRDEARRMLSRLEEEIRIMLNDLNSVPLARKIQAILNDWHDHQGHLQMMVRHIFYDMDTNKDGRLEWNNNEIRRFVHELFHRNGIPWPNWQEHVFYEMYRKADVDGSYSLELGESASFARICFEAALQLALTGHPEHVGDLIGSGSTTLAPGTRSAMTYSSGVVVDFLDYSHVFQPVIMANHAHRVRMVRVIESGEHLKTTMRTYRECDKDGNGRLTWNNGEIRDFIAACFRQHGLSPPNEEQTFHMYNKFDKDKNQYLDMRECLEMVDALFRSTFIIEVPVSKIASPQLEGQKVQYVRSPSPSPVVLVPTTTAGTAQMRSNSGNVPIRTVVTTAPKEIAVGSPRQQANLFDQVDTNHDGVISRNEWNSAMAQRHIAEVKEVQVPRIRDRSPSPHGAQQINRVSLGSLSRQIGMQPHSITLPVQVGQAAAPVLLHTSSPMLSAVPSASMGSVTAPSATIGSVSPVGTSPRPVSPGVPGVPAAVLGSRISTRPGRRA